MKILIQPPKDEWEFLLERPVKSLESLEPLVYEVFREIQAKGDEALLKYTQLFDGVALTSLRPTEQSLEEAESNLTESLKEAIVMAKKNIESFHRAQRLESRQIETAPGVFCWQEERPIDSVGLYIPGGSAPLFSTVLMLAIPAVIAGCKRIVLCSPPDKNGNIHPAILFAAKLCGVTDIYAIGGIQAIGAMTFGTDTIPKVYKIFGPGNQYVTAAKQLSLKFGVAIDMPAGPSEVMVLADDSANPAFIASDLLSQAEHGTDSQVVMVTTSEDLAEEVSREVASQLTTLPRKEIAEQAMANSMALVVNDRESVWEICNQYAPEHLIVQVREEEELAYLQAISNAGSVFVGSYSPESAGDYASGTNHTLPTNGYARMYSGVNLGAFQKTISFQKLTKEGIQHIGPAIEEMASAEGLEGHKRAVTQRLKAIENNAI